MQISPSSGQNVPLHNQHQSQQARQQPEAGTKAVLNDEISKKWKKQRGLNAQIDEIRQTFKTDQVFTSENGVDLVGGSGNQVVQRGILNNIRLGEDTGNKEIMANPFVGNNNILETWKTAGADKPRQIVQDYSKSPQDRRSEALKNQTIRSDVDMQA
ncbi:MAG: hypothetical protein GF398_07245 [Chitinivibrionales bacterium]|nr:hypothetical protein [Chitinivibrionales bacterium]